MPPAERRTGPAPNSALMLNPPDWPVIQSPQWRPDLLVLSCRVETTLQDCQSLFEIDNCSAKKRQEQSLFPVAIKIVGGRHEPLKHLGRI